jgi:hypothetical protein
MKFILHDNALQIVYAPFAIAVVLGTMFAVFIVSCKNGSPTGNKQHSEHVEEIGGMRVSNLKKAADYAEGSGIIFRGAEVAYQWGDTDKIYKIKGVADFVGNSTDSENSSVKMNFKNRYQAVLNNSQKTWWNNLDGKMDKVPNDTLWSWEPNNSLIAIIPSLDILIAGAGESSKNIWVTDNLSILEKFFNYIVDSVNFGSPYPNSSAFSNIKWDHRENIIRKGVGSDNWPLTWADDNNLYAAFGDGYGFEPRLQSKVSLGLAKISGTPPNFFGSNIQLPNQIHGDGKSGKKASGLLMVDGTLLVWVRNANAKGEGSQLAWSTDHGKTLQWCEWSFDQLGYCTFINYGKDYIGARDKYIYSVSHNSPSAYQRADSFVMMRVPIDKVLTRSAYEFFKGLDEKNNPVWTTNIDERGAVFEDKGRCYRSGISYNSPLKRYFWWQAKFQDGVDGRFQSKSFGIFDSPEPWGPWSTVYFTESWDAATGETGSFPTKWMNDSGLIMYLAFSGNDSFSVRKATLTLSSIK